MNTEFEREALDRIIRIESRLVQLGDFVGANLRTKQRIEVVRSANGTAITIDALDVSLARVYAELALTEKKYHVTLPATPIPVYHQDKLVMMVYP